MVVGEKVPLSIEEYELAVANTEPGTEINDYRWEEFHSTTTTIPFVKDNEFDYAWLLGFLGDDAEDWAWIVFIPIVLIIVTAVSNGANLTDGLDGLATGSSAIIGTTLAILAYVSGNYIIADYLNIMFLPNGSKVFFILSFIVFKLRFFLLINSVCGFDLILFFICAAVRK